jgi:hypothetical protein
MPAGPSAEMGVLTESEQGTSLRIRPNRQARPKLRAP